MRPRRSRLAQMPHKRRKEVLGTYPPTRLTTVILGEQEMLLRRLLGAEPIPNMKDFETPSNPSSPQTNPNSMSALYAAHRSPGTERRPPH